jgi:hypothetical protein
VSKAVALRSRGACERTVEASYMTFSIELTSGAEILVTADSAPVRHHVGALFAQGTDAKGFDWCEDRK